MLQVFYIKTLHKHLFVCSRHVCLVKRLLIFVCVVQLDCTKKDYQCKKADSPQAGKTWQTVPTVTVKMTKLASMMTSIKIAMLYRRENFYRFCYCYSGYSFNCLSTTPRAASESSEYIIGYSKYLLCVKQNKIGVITLLST